MKRIVRGLQAAAKIIGRAQTWLILTLFYFVILTPVALVFRWLADPLQLRKTPRSSWRAKTEPPDRWSWAKAQS